MLDWGCVEHSANKIGRHVKRKKMPFVWLHGFAYNVIGIFLGFRVVFVAICIGVDVIVHY